MIQIIESNRKPTAGEKFSSAVSGGIKSGAQFMQQLRAKQQQEEQTQLRNQKLKELTGMDLSGLSEPMQQKALESAFQRQLQGEKFGFESEKAGQKLRGEQEEKDASKNITQDAFNRMAQLIPKVGMGSGVLGMFGGKQAEHSGEFSSLTGALESHLVDMVNKGTLSNTRFKYITETLLPKPTDTQDEIKGKMKGLALILDLDPSVLGSGPISKKSKRPPISSFGR